MKNLIIALGIVVILAAAYIVYKNYYPATLKNDSSVNPQVANSFDQCVMAGNPVQESYPPVCVSNGKSFTQYIGNELEKTDLITINSPRPNAEIASPLTISGKARGTWFFEGSFPVKLYDNTGQLIASGVAVAQGEWMTEKFVNYNLTLKFTKPTTEKGKLVLEKDNPSAKKEFEDSLIVPIIFK